MYTSRIDEILKIHENPPDLGVRTPPPGAEIARENLGAGPQK
jgi:hypothetical protein